jgi:mono/diheme cytochrome c family protein
MTRRRKISLAGLIAGELITMWTTNRGPSASAQEEHRHAHAPASAKESKNPLTITDENIASGRTLFQQHCASCHGANGRAQTGTAAAMKVKPADLMSNAARGLTPGEIYWVIANGIKSSGMPAFKTKMNENERWQTTLCIRHLQGEHQHAPRNQAPQTTPKSDHAQHQGGHSMTSMMTTVTVGLSALCMRSDLGLRCNRPRHHWPLGIGCRTSG